MSLQLDNAYKADQISVFLENRAGRLGEVIQLLADANINIRGLSLADTSDFGILRLIVSNPDESETVLKEHGLATGRTTVVALELDDKPGSLNTILVLLAANCINVEYMYACARRSQDKIIMIFRFDKVDNAIALLSERGETLVAPEQLYHI